MSDRDEWIDVFLNRFFRARDGSATKRLLLLDHRGRTAGAWNREGIKQLLRRTMKPQEASAK